ncbi:MAG TPA: hypothetical protein VFU49_06565 [Ktedonobacteraceae bacterium]|nr:hypothetical protein [Ktedonobacteraceae bacterium]
MSNTDDFFWNWRNRQYFVWLSGRGQVQRARATRRCVHHLLLPG